MILVTHRFEFCAAHRYWRDDWSLEHNQHIFGKCSNPHGHGHNYTLDVTLRGTPDPQTGLIINNAAFKHIITTILEEFDHRHLNNDTPYFRDRLPTTENIVSTLWNLIAPQIPPQIALTRLRLYELPDLWAECTGTEDTHFARSYTFSAAHRLHLPTLSDEQNHHLYGKCAHPTDHGHNYTIDVTIGGPIDPTTGMVINLVTLDQTIQTILDEIDHKHLEREIPAFAEHPATPENLITYLWACLAASLGSQLRHLRLWQTKQTYVEYPSEPQTPQNHPFH